MEKFENPPTTETNENISPTIQEYLQKRNIEGNVIEVSLYSGARIESNPGEQGQVLITEKLNGCMATIIYTEQKDMKSSAQLVHFPPFMLDRHLEKISSLTTQDDVDATKKYALVYLQLKRKENEDAIISHIKTVLGDNVSIHVEYYEAGDESDIAGIEINPEHVVYHVGAKEVDVK